MKLIITDEKLIISSILICVAPLILIACSLNPERENISVFSVITGSETHPSVSKVFADVQILAQHNGLVKNDVDVRAEATNVSYSGRGIALTVTHSTGSSRVNFEIFGDADFGHAIAIRRLYHNLFKEFSQRYGLNSLSHDYSEFVSAERVKGVEGVRGVGAEGDGIKLYSR